MKLTKKEQYLIDNGRHLETIEFCRKCKIKSSDLVWFVERIEKEQFNINHQSSESKIKKVVKLFDINKQSRKLHIRRRKLEAAINDANNNLENEESINSRILHKFKDGWFIISLTHKELKYEAFQMSNCILDYKEGVKNKKISILALKNKKSQTICHMEISKSGCLFQIYQKANKITNHQNWEYINTFFKAYEDKNIYDRIKSLNLEILYNINFKQHQHNYIPIVQSFFPTQFSTSINNIEKKEISSTFKVKEFMNTDSIFPKELYEGTLDDVIVRLNEFKTFVDHSINNMVKSISNSFDNFFILNDDIIERLYGKSDIYFEDKLNNIIEERKQIQIGAEVPEELMEGMYDHPEEEFGELDIELCGETCKEEQIEVDVEVDDVFNFRYDVPKEFVNLGN